VDSVDLQVVTSVERTIEDRLRAMAPRRWALTRLTDAPSNQLLVLLAPDVDIERAKGVIQSTASFELKLVEQGPAPSKEALLQATNGVEPSDAEVLSAVGERATAGEQPQALFYLVRKWPIITARDLRTAKAVPDQCGFPAVHFWLKSDSAARFAKVTRENINRRLAIVLERTVISAPTIEGRIAEEGQITGRFTWRETDDLALKLRSGTLEAAVTIVGQRVVGRVGQRLR
jgi:preprotein translocase subunit SecD